MFRKEILAGIDDGGNGGDDDYDHGNNHPTARTEFDMLTAIHDAIVWSERKQSRANSAHKDEEIGEWVIRPELLTLAIGPRYIDMGMKAEVRDGQLHVSCSVGAAI